MNQKAGIVICTRNREEDVFKLLSLLKSHPNWVEYPIWVHDDASDKVSEQYWEELPKQTFRFIRSPRNYGTCIGRNISYTSAPFEFIFSVDDDSCFVDENGPKLAIEYMEKNPHVAILSFPLVSSFNPPPVEDTSPYPCLSFVGCAALIRQSVFVKLGGYHSDFFYYGEEPELSLRIWSAGYEVHAFPACRVHHWVTPQSRSNRRMGFYGPRNRIWTHILHTPMPVLPIEILRALGSYTKLSWRTKIPLVHFQGVSSGIYKGIASINKRQALPGSLYSYLTSLPIAAKNQL